MAYAHTPAGSLSGTVFQARGLFANLREAFRRRRVYARTVSELSELSTMELADLGLSRSMIRRVALEAAYGKAV